MGTGHKPVCALLHSRLNAQASSQAWTIHQRVGGGGDADYGRRWVIIARRFTLTAEFVLAMFASDEKTALARYLAFVADDTDDELRSEFYSGACDGRILGNDDFADKAIQKAHQEPSERYTLSDVLATVSSILKIAETEIVAPVKPMKVVKRGR